MRFRRAFDQVAHWNANVHDTLQLLSYWSPAINASRELGFLVGGYKRAFAAIEPQVRREVEDEYSKRLKGATARETRRLRKEIEAEIVKRVEKRAPPDALY